MKRKNLLLFTNILIPLFIGLAIYLFCYNNTYINTKFESVFGFSLPYLYYDNAFHRFITCWACDILWAYSLTFSLFLCFKDFKKSLLISCGLSALLAVIIEFLQLLALINGTFDVLDIIFEITAVLIAVIIIKRSF